jgi:ABC-2 type transport system permease protein
METMNRVGHSLIRMLAFFRKEIVEIVRQPRLLLSLVLGPFLILFLFGVGYRNQPRAVRSLFVVPAGSNVGSLIQQYANSLGPQLIFSGTTNDLNAALAELDNNQVDVVVQVPQNIDGLLSQNQQAVFTLYHNEIDPTQGQYIKYLGTNYINEVNRRVVSAYAQQAQQESAQVLPKLESARKDATAMRSALQAGDTASARQSQQSLNQNMGAAMSSVQTRLLLATILQQELGQTGGSQDQNLAAALKSMQDILKTTSDNSAVPVTGGSNVEAQVAQLQNTENEITKIEDQLRSFQAISPSVLVSPFRSETKSIAPFGDIEPAVFFTPAVIALLLQHLAVTFGALSIIRERRSGTMEMFRVSPISAAETLIGKYLSYMTLGIFMAALLTTLLIYVLHMPMLGGLLNYAIIVVLLLFCSLGLGFVISLVAETESQAVQLAMISLLVSVFFSGMFLDLRYLWTPVRVISWLTPATYGTLLFQQVMLRGYGLSLLYVLGLVFIGLYLFLLALRSLHNEMKLG